MNAHAAPRNATGAPARRRWRACLLLLALAACPPGLWPALAAPATTWMADNGNGSFTNPLFYDEFSDPDLIRVGDDFYMVGTTMHAVPGLPVLHSRDLVNWRFLSYAMPGFGPGDAFRLANGQESYGQGIWAPCIRYHDGTFYIFSNINGHGVQVFTARDPAGPWQHRSLGRSLHDLSVLFDDDGRVYAVYDYQQVRMVELKPDLSGVVEGSDRVLIPAGQAMGEGHHFYKIDGRYYIISANYAPVGRMQAARADRVEGPYETVVISAGETMGTQRGWWLDNIGQRDPLPTGATPFRMHKPGDNALGAVPLHQGGIVQLANGQWWGVSMMDLKSVGRTTFLSPVTWHDGWPYFGLPGNLGRSPRTWSKPDVGMATTPSATWERSDDFSAPALKPLWQWNHEPVPGKWSLSEKPGALRLHSLPADGFLWARNTLTQRAIGPESSATVQLDASGLRPGDNAGLGLLNIPAAWIGVVREEAGLALRWYTQEGDRHLDVPLPAARVHLRASADFDDDMAQLAYSLDGERFIPLGDPLRTPYGLKTFQGVRYALFAYSATGAAGGHADFDDFRVEEPLADRSRNVPFGQVVRARVQQVIGLAYKNIGQPQRAEELLRAAVDGLLADGVDEPMLAAGAMSDLATLLANDRRGTEAEAMARRALAVLDGEAAADGAAAAHAWNSLRLALMEQEHFDDAEAALLRSMEMRRLLPDAPRMLAVAKHNLGLLYRRRGDLAGSEAALEEALSMKRELSGERSYEVLSTRHVLAMTLAEQGRLAEAERLQRQNLALARELFGEASDHTATAYNELASLNQDLGEYALAAEYYDRALAVEAEVSGEQSVSYMVTLNNLATLEESRGDPERALQLFRRSFEYRRASLGPDNPSALRAEVNLGRALMRVGRLA